MKKICFQNIPAESEMNANEAPHSRAVGYLMSQATEVAFTIACPNRSRAAGYNDEY